VELISATPDKRSKRICHLRMVICYLPIREALAWAVLIDAPMMPASSRSSLKMTNNQSQIVNDQFFMLPLTLDTKLRSGQWALTI
jgi:hypothetical protein